MSDYEALTYLTLFIMLLAAFVYWEKRKERRRKP
jgi:cbb3-type cytochrome oxidase subunit 3